MAEDSKQSVCEERSLKVVRSFAAKPMACLPLKGRWLERAGFVTGERVRVSVRHRLLVIVVEEGES